MGNVTSLMSNKYSKTIPAKRDISRLQLLTTPYFLGSLILLLTNDWILKDLFPGFLTGKISDFSGLFAFSLFWCAIIPGYPVLILTLLGCLFILWKLPFADPIIESWNTFLPKLSIGRVQDYTDLFALLVLPAVYLVLTMPPISNFSRKLTQLTVFAISIFAFSGTTCVHNIAHLDLEKFSKYREAQFSEHTFGQGGHPCETSETGTPYRIKVNLGEEALIENINQRGFQTDWSFGVSPWTGYCCRVRPIIGSGNCCEALFWTEGVDILDPTSGACLIEKGDFKLEKHGDETEILLFSLSLCDAKQLSDKGAIDHFIKVVLGNSWIISSENLPPHGTSLKLLYHTSIIF